MKTILRMILGLLLSFVMGSMVASAIDVPVLWGGIAGVVTGALPQPQGVALLTVSTNYAGTVYESILAKLAVGNELVKNKLFKPVGFEDLLSKYYIPRIKITGSVLQHRKETPEDTDSRGDISYDEKVLDAKDFMVYLTFNPRIFEKLWSPFRAEKALVFQELPEEIQAKMLAQLHGQIATEVGLHMLVGEKSPDPDNPTDGKYFDGFLTRIRASGDVVKISNPEALDSDNILDVYAAVKKALPVEIRSRQDLAMLCSWNAYDLYDDAVTSVKQNVGYDSEFTRKYKGIPLIPLAGMPDDTIVCTYTGANETSNLWGGLTYSDAPEPILIDRVTNHSERYGLKMLMKADTNIAWDEHIVLYDA